MKGYCFFKSIRCENFFLIYYVELLTKNKPKVIVAARLWNATLQFETLNENKLLNQMVLCLGRWTGGNFITKRKMNLKYFKNGDPKRTLEVQTIFAILKKKVEAITLGKPNFFSNKKIFKQCNLVIVVGISCC